MSKFGTIGRTGSAMGPPKFGTGGPKVRKQCYVFDSSIAIVADYNKFTKQKIPGGQMENNFLANFTFSQWHQLSPVDPGVVNCNTNPELCKSECVYQDKFSEQATGCTGGSFGSMDLGQFTHRLLKNGPNDYPSQACFDAGKNKKGIFMVDGRGGINCSKRGLVCLTDDEKEDVLYWPWTDPGDGGHWNFMIAGQSKLDFPGGGVSIIPPQGEHPDLVTSVTWDLLKFIAQTQPKAPEASCSPLCCLAKQTFLGPMKGQSTKQEEPSSSPHNQMAMHKFHALMNVGHGSATGAAYSGVNSCKWVLNPNIDTTGSDHPKLEAECKCGK